MKKVSLELQIKIVSAYLDGISYKHIQDIFKVSRWNIQDALSKFAIKTNRIKSPPRLQGRACKYKKKVTFIPIARPISTLMERYHDGDFLPPLSPYPNKQDEKPLLDDDMDYMERYNLEGTEESEFNNGSYLEIDISENDEIRYIKRE